jgi:hypothetical protein
MQPARRLCIGFIPQWKIEMKKPRSTDAVTRESAAPLPRAQDAVSERVYG